MDRVPEQMSERRDSIISDITRRTTRTPAWQSRSTDPTTHNGDDSQQHQPQPPTSSEEITSPTAVRKLVLNYLLHHCYLDTAQAFIHDGERATSSTSNGGDQGDTTAATPSTSSSATTLLASGSNLTPRPQHPLSAPPLSRADSQMEVEVDRQLATADAAAHDEDAEMTTEPFQAGQGVNTTIDTGADADEQMVDDVLNHASSSSRPVEDNKADFTNELSQLALREVRQRQEIRDHILAGRISHACELIHANFPSVLNAVAEPAQDEAARTTSASGNSATSPVGNTTTPSDPASDSLSSTSLAPHLLYKDSTSSASTSKTAGKQSSTGATFTLPTGPTSLDPQHLSLNLQIQAFIELIRPANASQPATQNGNSSNGISNGATSTSSANGANMPSSPMSSHAHATPGIAAASISRSASPALSSVSSASSSASHRSSNVSPALFSAYASARLLCAAIERLKDGPPKALYRKEAELVTAMLAYPDVDRSPLRKYLDVKRRKLLADQINSAIVFRCGRPAQPLIESAVRQTTFVMSELHNEQVAVPQDHPVYAAHIPGGRYTLQTTGSDPAWLSEPGKKGKGKVPSTFHLPNFLAER